MRAILAITSIILCGCASPQPDIASLPFGLDKFHWIMTSKEAAELFPAVAPRLPGSAAPYATNQSGVFLGPYKWRDCTFKLVFWFGYTNSNLIATAPPSRFRLMDEMRFKPIDPSIDALASIELRMPNDAPASPSCLRDFQRELRSHFETDPPVGKADARTDWHTPTMNAFSTQINWGKGLAASLFMFSKDARAPLIVD